MVGTVKPLGAKAYHSIPHLPGSRVGPGDHTVTEGQARICTERPRDRHDVVVLQHKLDGSCVSAALVGGQLLALGRAGHLAQSSPYRQHQLFAHWVRLNEGRFRAVLEEGERLCGEWLAQAHGTRMRLPHEPFVAFDLIRGVENAIRRAPYEEFHARIAAGDFVEPALLSYGPPVPLAPALELLDESAPAHGCLDPPEGVVYRVERRGKVEYLCKFVRAAKVDGRYLPEHNGGEAIWHWEP
jgi:hypothetical protein